MAKTSLSVPNEYMRKICSTAPSRLIPVGSVHPYDNDALDKLRTLKSQGVHLIKWLPNSQHIAPGHPKSIKFLSEMAKLKMVLIAHVGDEHAVSATGINNDYGNPELFRRALETEPDFRVIFAHVGSEGTSVINGKKRENFDLVIELLKKYPKQTFADISAFSSAIRRVGYLPRLLREKSIHAQLIYGTDYPLPAISGLVFWATKKMWTKSLLTLRQTSLIHEIFRHNPLAAAFVTMRQISFEGSSLPAEVFYKNFSKAFHKGHVPPQLPPS
jgi:predicted TIM-barrel fold metal-dependent hydrolase